VLPVYPAQILLKIDCSHQRNDPFKLPWHSDSKTAKNSQKRLGVLSKKLNSKLAEKRVRKCLNQQKEYKSTKEISQI